jgi:hypothetical protein
MKTIIIIYGKLIIILIIIICNNEYEKYGGVWNNENKITNNMCNNNV